MRPDDMKELLKRKPFFVDCGDYPCEVRDGCFNDSSDDIFEDPSDEIKSWKLTPLLQKRSFFSKVKDGVKRLFRIKSISAP